jgi:hypothetical protein
VFGATEGETCWLFEVETGGEGRQAKLVGIALKGLSFLGTGHWIIFYNRRILY